MPTDGNGRSSDFGPERESESYSILSMLYGKIGNTNGGAYVRTGSSSTNVVETLKILTALTSGQDSGVIK